MEARFLLFFSFFPVPVGSSFPSCFDVESGGNCQVLCTSKCRYPGGQLRLSLLKWLIKEIHRVQKAGRDCPNQLYHPVIF